MDACGTAHAVDSLGISLTYDRLGVYNVLVSLKEGLQGTDPLGGQAGWGKEGWILSRLPLFPTHWVGLEPLSAGGLPQKSMGKTGR